MARKRTKTEWLQTLLSIIVVLLLVGVLIFLVTYQPKEETGAQEIATVERRTVQRTAEESGVVVQRTIDDNEQLAVQLFLDEFTIPDVNTDQSVDMIIAALDDIETIGVIDSITDIPRITGDTTEYEVVVQFDTVPEDLREGMHVDVSIVLASVDDVLAVPNQSVYMVEDTYMVDRVQEERRVALPRLKVDESSVSTEPTAVEIGLEGDEFTEITEGLAEGDKVVLQYP